MPLFNRVYRILFRTMTMRREIKIIQSWEQFNDLFGQLWEPSLVHLHSKMTTTNYGCLRPRLHLRPTPSLYLFLLGLSVDVAHGWKCLYREFPVDVQRIRGTWWIYGTKPQPTDRCYMEELDLYWTRITQTDYDNYAVELHCSLPWFRHQMAIYTRAPEPNELVIGQVEKYLRSVQLSIKDFYLVDKYSCHNDSKEPEQRWHLSKYMHLDYNPYYVKPLVVDKDI